MTHVYLYPIGDENSLFEFNHICLAMGRGFTKYIERISEVHELNDTLRVIAPGVYLRSGTWQLEIERAEFLVRSASFTPHLANEPSLTIRNSGLLKSETQSVSEKAEIVTSFEGAYLIEESVSAKKLFDFATQSVLEELSRKVDGQKASEVFDFRGQSRREKAP